MNYRFATNFTLESQRLDGTNRQILLQGQDNIHGLAYDWIGKNIYWASSNKLYALNTDNPTLQKSVIKVYSPEYVLHFVYLNRVIHYRCLG